MQLPNESMLCSLKFLYPRGVQFCIILDMYRCWFLSVNMNGFFLLLYKWKEFSFIHSCFFFVTFIYFFLFFLLLFFFFEGEELLNGKKDTLEKRSTTDLVLYNQKDHLRTHNPFIFGHPTDLELYQQNVTWH